MPRSLQALAGGRGLNRVWRVATAAGVFVLRLRHEPVDRPGSFSCFELASHRLAADAGLAPRLVDAAPDGRWLLMEFVDSPAWSDALLLSDAGIDALGTRLQRLHSLACEGLPRVDVAGIARGYLGRIQGQEQDFAGAAAHVVALEHESQELGRLSDRAVLNHGDLMAANILGPAGPGALLVDWEYAQRADPTWDVACLLAYYPVLEQRLDRLMAAADLRTADDRHILSIQGRVFTGLNRLWQRAEAGNWIS